MENVNSVNIPESPAPVNRLAQQGIGGVGISRRQQRQAKRDGERRLREQSFDANQKVTKHELRQLMGAMVRLQQDMNDYAAFVRNVFFVLESKGLVSLGEMDEVAKKKRQEAKDFEEIHKREDIPMSEKLAIAKEKGLSQMFLDILAQPEQPAKPPEIPGGAKKD